MPAVQVRDWHSLSCPGQVDATRHSAQAPLPSHTVPVPSAHTPPAIVFGFEGTPPVQMSSVQALLSTGLSLLSGIATIAPEPSHCCDLQSPAVCAAIRVPAGALEKPQTPTVQVGVWHSLAAAGQSLAEAQPTQAPLPSHLVVAPAAPHAVPAAEFGFDATPPVHTSSVHSLLSLGLSASSLTSATAPLPSHCFALQSPAVCPATTVPLATGAVPHFPASQVFVTHSLAGVGHSSGLVHSGALPPVPPAPPVLLVDVVAVPPAPSMRLRSTDVISSQPKAPTASAANIAHLAVPATLVPRSIMGATSPGAWCQVKPPARLGT